MVATVFLKKNLSIPPTLKIGEGYGFNVVVVKDLVFAKPKRSTELLTSKEDTMAKQRRSKPNHTMTIGHNLTKKVAQPTAAPLKNASPISHQSLEHATP